jgi:hypothetical protein
VTFAATFTFAVSERSWSSTKSVAKSNGSPERQPAGLQVEVAHFAPALLLAILHHDRRVVDFQTGHRRHFGGAARGLVLFAFALAEIRPVVAAALVRDQPDARAVEPHIADFDLAAEQRHQAHAQPRVP